MRAALYARVSTSEAEDRQDPETQLIRLRDWARALGVEPHAEYVDRASGADPNRPALRRLMADARRRKFDTVLIVRLDRIMRSTENLLATLREMKGHGVSLRCLDQPIDTATPEGEMVITILAAVAQFERELIRARVRDGMARAKRSGTRSGRPIGRPRKRPRGAVLADARARLDAGAPLATVARDLDIPRSTLRRALGVQKGGARA